MTGKYNVRNYTRFANLDHSEYTFGKALKEAGYKTCIVGKWQLGGNAKTIKNHGFDEHCLWQIAGARDERYKPHITNKRTKSKLHGQIRAKNTARFC